MALNRGIEGCAMADPFNEMRKLDDEDLARDIRIAAQQLKNTGEVPDVARLHKIFKRNALECGMTEKGAQATATLRFENSRDF